MRTDVSKRRVRPPKGLVQEIASGLRNVEADLESLDNGIKYVCPGDFMPILMPFVCVCVCAQAKPRWKKMWEKELKDIVSEQTIIKEQEGKIGDLDDTLQDLKELYEKLEQV